MTETLDRAVAVPAEVEPATETPDRTTRLTANPYLTVVQCTDDEVLLRHGSRSRYSRVLRDDGRRRILGPLIRTFRSGATLTQVSEELADRAAAADIEEFVAQLRDEGVLVPEDSGTLAVYRSLVGGAGVAGLSTSDVTVLGLGPIGAQIGHQLAELGAGSIVGIDHRDEKVASLQDVASRAGLSNVDGRIGSLDDDDALLEDVVDEADLVVLAIEAFRPALLHRVNRAAVARQRAWLPVYVDGSEMIVGPLVVPGRSPCYNEHEIQHESSRMLRHEFLLYSEELGRGGELPDLLPPYAAIAASWAVVGLLPYLVDGTSFLVGRAIRIDFERLEITQEHVLRLPRCPVCVAERPDFRHPFL